jgi:hypothetical protein
MSEKIVDDGCGLWTWADSLSTASECRPLPGKIAAFGPIHLARTASTGHFLNSRKSVTLENLLNTHNAEPTRSISGKYQEKEGKYSGSGTPLP